MNACMLAKALYLHRSASHAQGMHGSSYVNPHNMPIGQTNLDHPSLRLSSKMIPDSTIFTVKSNLHTCFSSHQELGFSSLNERENSL